MKCDIDFSQIEAIGEFLEIKDYDLFINLLATLKAFSNEKNKADSLQ